MNIIDSVDEQIVRLLGKDGRQTSETLGKQLNLSAATVRRRLRKLIHSDLLRIVGVVDPSSFGFPMIAVISLDVAHDKVELAVEELSKRPEVSFVSTTTGRYDIIAIARFRSIDCLSEFVTKELAKLEGVRDSETFICLQEKKGRRIPLTEI
jgi:Lrp/AsnC family transcriptional regulator for asnA, asnC and gidA